MIPLKLEIKNFLSYGDAIQTVDFSNYNLLCLSGKNGNGKSALLDAITWAVWGQARKVGGISKADDGLLRLGQTRMMVALTLSLNGKKYRVRREYAKTYGKPLASLDFEIFDEAGNFFKSLTDKTIRATQEAIERTINLDYDTFINSAFLRQGQSNEFSKKTAKERKQILAGILGLGNYDTLQQHALATAKKFELQSSALRQLITHIESEIDKEPALQSSFTLLIQQLDTTNQELTATQKLLSTQERLLQQQEEQERLKIFIEQEQRVLSQRFNLLSDQFSETRRSWQSLHLILRDQPSPEALASRREALVIQKKEHGVLKETLVQLERMRSLQIQKIQEKQFQLEQEHAQAYQKTALFLEKERLTLQQKTADHERINAELSQIATKVTQLKKDLLEGATIIQQEAMFNKDAATIKQQFEKRRSFYQKMVQIGNQDMAEIKELEQKKVLLKADQAAQCPLCRQELSPISHDQVVHDIQRREQFVNHRINRVTALLKILKQLLVQQHDACKALDHQAIIFAQLHTTLNEKKLQQAEATAKQTLLIETVTQLKQDVVVQSEELKKITATLEQLNNQTGLINNHPEMEKLTTALTVLNNNITSCTDKIASYVDADTLLNELEQLQQATADRSTFEHKLATLRQKSYEQLATLRDLKKQSALYVATLKNLQAVDTDQLKQSIHEHQTKKELFEKQKSTQTQEQGSISSNLERIAALKIEIAQKRTDFKALQDEIDDYESLAFAFGKNGIQALLIEEAIPEIEQEANNLLSKLTDNQAQIFIESLRDLKSGGVKETLEIKVADAAGIRPYEMFSGGEAFRVDFALRIAISKLLTRRAGTALQTLIIDEGFGSQDEEGLARIMNALYAIQNDFSKIIIVSHLNEFKENFPVHFVVEKNSTGSVVRVEERG